MVGVKKGIDIVDPGVQLVLVLGEAGHQGIEGEQGKKDKSQDNQDTQAGHDKGCMEIGKAFLPEPEHGRQGEQGKDDGHQEERDDKRDRLHSNDDEKNECDGKQPSFHSGKFRWKDNQFPMWVVK
jgi:hypothetical protein